MDVQYQVNHNLNMPWTFKLVNKTFRFRLHEWADIRTYKRFLRTSVYVTNGVVYNCVKKRPFNIKYRELTQSSNIKFVLVDTR